MDAKSDTPRCVVFGAFEEFVLLDLVGPLEAFRTARYALTSGKVPPYRLRVVSARGGQVRSQSGLSVDTEPVSALADEEIDTIIVPGGGPADRPQLAESLHPWLIERAPRARRVCSVCTGAFVLGAAGLLHGRQATTHWLAFDLFARRNPTTTVKRGPIFVKDEKFWTAAGMTAGIDLALALIEEDLGYEAAMTAARVLVMFLRRPGGQDQFSAPLAAQSRTDQRFSTMIAWISDNLGRDLSVGFLAERAGMSMRTFARTFTKQVGRTPARHVEDLRVEAARRALEKGGTPIKEIARRLGFGDEQGLRRAFQRRLQTTPNAYRARFGSSQR